MRSIKYVLMHPFWKKILITIGILIAVLLFVFVLFVGWYTWQLRSSDAETRIDLISTFEPNTISLLTNSAKPTEKVAHPETYIHSHNPTFGTPSAPVTIMAFIDFECPYCRRAYTTFESIREKYSPVVQVVFKHFPISVIHPNAERSAVAAQCAHQQNKFWEYYEMLFEKQQLTEESLLSYAEELLLNIPLFTECLDSSQTLHRVQTDMQDGTEIGVRGTPTYIINGTIFEGVLSEDNWDQIILKTLQGS